MTCSLLHYNQITLTAVLRADCRGARVGTGTADRMQSQLSRRDNAGIDRIVIVGVVKSGQSVSFGVEFKGRVRWSCYTLDVVCEGGKGQIRRLQPRCWTYESGGRA